MKRKVVLPGSKTGELREVYVDFGPAKTDCQPTDANGKVVGAARSARRSRAVFDRKGFLIR